MGRVDRLWLQTFVCFLGLLAVTGCSTPRYARLADLDNALDRAVGKNQRLNAFYCSDPTDCIPDREEYRVSWTMICGDTPTDPCDGAQQKYQDIFNGSAKIVAILKQIRFTIDGLKNGDFTQRDALPLIAFATRILPGLVETVKKLISGVGSLKPVSDLVSSPLLAPKVAAALPGLASTLGSLVSEVGGVIADFANIGKSSPTATAQEAKAKTVDYKAAKALKQASRTRPPAPPENPANPPPSSPGGYQEVPEAQQPGREEFHQGAALFEKERYDEAIVWFQKAYDLSGRKPTTVLALAQCERALKRIPDAVRHYQEYLSLKPRPKSADEVEATVRALQLQQQKAAEPRTAESDKLTVVAEKQDALPQTQGETVQDMGPEVPQGDARVAMAAAGPSPPGSVAVVESARQPGGRVWTWVAAGVGVASLAVATVSWLNANAARDELLKTCGSTGCTQAQIERSGGPSAVVLANVFVGASAAAFVGAAVLFFVEAPKDTVSVTAGPSGIGVAGRF